MAEHANNTPRTRSPAAGRRTPAAPAAPDMPPLSADELRQEQELLAQMQEVHGLLVKRNLETAVLLAQQAARHGGELAEHFGELGRRFGHLLDAPSRRKSALRVVKGGAA